MKKIIFVMLVFAGLAQGCSTQKYWSAMGGSRADGTVRLGYSTGGFERPVISMAQGDSLADEHCQAWGYKGASPFGGQTRECMAYNDYGCVRWNIFAEYQCLSDEL